MRLTKEALISHVCKDMERIEYQVVDVLSDESLQTLTTENPDKVIFSIVEGNQVGNKLFLTSHQFTNVVGTDIYIYIGNSQGQTAYQMLLDELSKVRRLDEKLVTFLRDECNDSFTEIDLREELPEKIPEKLASSIEQAPSQLTYVLISESMINKGIGEALVNNQFDVIGDSHILIYNGNSSGAQMIARLNQESFTTIE